jgi:MoaA/NifB/PqqE/SkfB family radical SAM enzyme
MIDTNENKNFCPAPWISLYAEPSGRVDNCCVAKNYIGTVDVPIEQVLTGTKNIKIQTDMLNNVEVPGCSWCKNSPENLQQNLLTKYPDHTDPLYQPEKFQLKYLDARWSNTCNLACVYCGPGFSSLWAQELDKVVKITKESKNNLLEYVVSNVESLVDVYLAGGEPLLMKENEILIEEIVNRNPNCKILVNTNLLNVDTKIYKRLISLPNVQWLVSFETMEDQFEYIRYPGDWFQFRTNLLNLLETVGSERINFNMVYLNLNYLTFWDAVDWAESQGFLKSKMSIALYNNGVHDGPLDLRSLSDQSREQAKQRILSKDYSMLFGYNKTLDYLQGDVKINKNFVKHCTGMDKRRNLNSRSIFPDVYQSIESTYESN